MRSLGGAERSRPACGTKRDLVLVLVLAGLAAPAARAAAPVPALELQLVPSAVAVPSRGSVEVLAIVRNNGESPVAEVRLSAFTDAGVKIAIDPPTAAALEPYGALASTLRIFRAPEGPLSGKAHVRVDYTWKREGGASRRVAVESLTIAAQEPESVEQVAEVEARTVLTSLMEYRPGVVYIAVTNKSKAPIDVIDVAANAPEFISVSRPKDATRKGLPPLGVHVVPFQIEAEGDSTPGKHLLLFQVDLQWQKGGRPASGTLIETHEVNVGILAESEILTALGVPTFLLLPGTLMLLTIGLLWAHVPRRGSRTADGFPIKAKTAEFWLVAITLSIVMAVLYPVVTDWFGERRNYLEGYGLGDVVRVWTASILCSVVAFLLWVSGSDLLERRRTPAENDSPIALLRKLHRQGLSVYLKRADVTVEGKEEPQRAFLLQPLDGRAKIWVGPSILVDWRGTERALRNEAEGQIRPEGDAGKLARLLTRAKQQKAEIHWQPIGELLKPREVDSSAVKEVPGEDSIVEQA